MKKILIIRFSSIGDIVLTTPVIRCLNRQLRDTEIHVLTKVAYQSIYSANPNVAKVIVMKHDLKEVMPELRGERYDFVVDLHRNWRSLWVRMALRCHSSSFPKLDFQKFLYAKMKLGTLPKVHVVDRYFEAVKKLGVINDGEGLDFYIPEADVIRMEDLPEGFRDGFVALVIGGQHNTKILPINKVVEVCRNLGCPVILVGGPEDVSRGDAIVDAVGPSVYNSCGQFRLGQSASLLKLADVVIANDTGMMHIAAALRKRMVTVWGNTVPEFGMFPYLPKGMEPAVIIENKALPCRPCDKLGYERCPKGHFNCMNGLDAKEIAEKTKARLSPGLRSGTSGN